MKINKKKSKKKRHNKKYNKNFLNFSFKRKAGAPPTDQEFLDAINYLISNEISQEKYRQTLESYALFDLAYLITRLDNMSPSRRNMIFGYPERLRQVRQDINQLLEIKNASLMQKPFLSSSLAASSSFQSPSFLEPDRQSLPLMSSKAVQKPIIERPRLDISAHASKRMRERNITNDDLLRIIGNQEPQEVTISGDPRLLYTERWGDRGEFIRIVTNPDRKRPTIITVVRNEPIPDEFTQSALQTIEENNLDKDYILQIIQNVKPQTERNNLLFKWDDLSIMTNKEKTIVTSIRVNKLLFTNTAEVSMRENNISYETIRRILDEIKPEPAEEGEDGRPRLLFYDADNNIEVYTNEDQNTIIGVFYRPPPDTLRSTISQPLLTHTIDWQTEGCALQRTNIDISKGIDCGRCAMSYAGIGTPRARSELQNLCVNESGLNNYNENRWLYYNARRPYGISDEEWKDLAPRGYQISRAFRRKHSDKSMGIIGEIVFDKLLDRGEQVIGGWLIYQKDRSRDKFVSGHRFNIAKTIYDDRVWYVDAQHEINPGEVLFIDKIIEKEDPSENKYVSDIDLILTPWQASQLVDDDGTSMVEEVIPLMKVGGSKKKTLKKHRKKKKTRYAKNKR